MNDHDAPRPVLGVLSTIPARRELTISQAEQGLRISQIHGCTEQSVFKGPNEWSRWSDLCVPQKELVDEVGVRD